MKKKPPEWLRWAYLALAAAWPVSIWMDYREYSRYPALGIFSPEALTEIMAEIHYRWALYVLMTVIFLFQFITFHWEKRDNKYLSFEGILLIAAFAVWACLPFIMPLPNANGLWVFILITLGAVVIYTIYKFVKNKRLEEETYE